MSDEDSAKRLPTVVLVHGAFADGSSWGGVIERLQARGITAIAPANPLRGLTSDSAYIAGVFEQTPGPVVAVAESLDLRPEERLEVLLSGDVLARDVHPTDAHERRRSLRPLHGRVVDIMSLRGRLLNAEDGTHLRDGSGESPMGSFSQGLSTVRPVGPEDRMPSGGSLGDDGVAPAVAFDHCVD